MFCPASQALRRYTAGTSWETTDKAKLDGLYAHNISLWLDARCFFQTLIKVGSGEGIVEGIKPARQNTEENQVKRILIAGQDSYIGGRLAAWLDTARFQCDILSMRGNAWQEHSFAGYDSVVLVAGIAHQRETEKNRSLYGKINHRLATEAGRKAKREGVAQFVFFSSIERIRHGSRPYPCGYPAQSGDCLWAK